MSNVKLILNYKLNQITTIQFILMYNFFSLMKLNKGGNLSSNLKSKLDPYFTNHNNQIILT